MTRWVQLVLVALVFVAPTAAVAQDQPTAPSPVAAPSPKASLEKETRVLKQLEAQLKQLAQKYAACLASAETHVPQAALVAANDRPAGSPALVLRAADLLFRGGQYSEALGRYRQLISQSEADSDNDQDWVAFQAANCLYRLARYQEAQEAYQQVARRFPQSPWATEAQWSTQMAGWQTDWSTRNPGKGDESTEVLNNE